MDWWKVWQWVAFLIPFANLAFQIWLHGFWGYLRILRASFAAIWRWFAYDPETFVDVTAVPPIMPGRRIPPAPPGSPGPPDEDEGDGGEIAIPARPAPNNLRQIELEPTDGD